MLFDNLIHTETSGLELGERVFVKLKAHQRELCVSGEKFQPTRDVNVNVKYAQNLF